MFLYCCCILLFVFTTCYWCCWCSYCFSPDRYKESILNCVPLRTSINFLVHVESYCNCFFLYFCMEFYFYKHIFGKKNTNERVFPFPWIYTKGPKYILRVWPRHTNDTSNNNPLHLQDECSTLASKRLKFQSSPYFGTLKNIVNIKSKQIIGYVNVIAISNKARAI